MVKTLSFTGLLASAWVLGVCFAGAQPAIADEGTARIEARRLFDEGVALAKSERWAEALSSFRQSRELVPRPSTSYNIANAYYRLDRPVEGLEELDTYDAMPEVLGDEAARRRGETLRELLRDAVAEALIVVSPKDAEVHVDGRRSDGDGNKRLVRMNPGRHSVRVTRDGYEPTTRELSVERGERPVYSIVLRPVVPPAPPAAVVAPSGAVNEPTPSDQADKKRFSKRPGFWAVIGATVAVGVGVGLAVGLTRRDSGGDQCGTTGTCATTQGVTVTSF